MREKLTRLLPMILLLLASLAPASAPLRAQAPAVVRRHPDGKHFAAPDGRLFFALGYNYEGPHDRAWRMWERYDINLINADLARARAGGANMLRIFVQEPLPGEILSGNFSKLDAVLNLMQQHGLLALLTFYDYGEIDLQKVAEVDRRVAERYRGHPAIMGYDLRNEPQFLTLATPTYPPGADVPLQRADLVGVYGERVSRADVPGYRQSGDGRVLPGHWSDDQVYAYANNLAYYREFLAANDRWVVSAPGRTSVDFPRSPEAQPWQPLWSAFDQTLSAWIGAQAGAIRGADPHHMVTIGWNNPLLAGLPANGQLDFQSLHRFPLPSTGTANLTVDIGHALRRVFPQHPLVFEEIGYTNHEIDASGSAALEMIVMLRAYSEGFAGFVKWQLTDLPPVGSPREDNFGAIRTDGSGKPIYHAMAAFQTYLSSTAAQPGGSVNTWSDGNGPGYRYSHHDALYVAAREGSGDGITVRLNAPGQVLLRKRGPIYLVSTQPGSVGLNLRVLMSSWTGGAARVEQRSGSSWQAVAARASGDDIEFDVQPAVPYRVVLPRHTDAATAKAGCRFFPETGHNLCGSFRRYWETRGGLAIFGFPLSEEFQERNSSDGNVYTVQYFERNRFEYHPEHAGSQYEVLLGLLGNDLTAGRRGEPPFQRVGGAPAGYDYYPETGHSLGEAFRAYWRANGGLAIFGYPISEEFEEYNPADGKIYTVQYFERNRFEYHPENAGTRYEVLLGLLGNQTVDGNGWR